MAKGRACHVAKGGAEGGDGKGRCGDEHKPAQRHARREELHRRKWRELRRRTLGPQLPKVHWLECRGCAQIGLDPSDMITAGQETRSSGPGVSAGNKLSPSASTLERGKQAV